METFETNLETCFCIRSYACTDLESIWYGRGAMGMCTNISSHSEVRNIPLVHGMNEMKKMFVVLESPELSKPKLKHYPITLSEHARYFASYPIDSKSVQA